MRKRKRVFKVRKDAKRRKPNTKMIRRIANQIVQRNIETKTSQNTVTDGVEILHNNFVTLTSQLLYTFQGTSDPEASIGARIGDRIKLKGVSLRMMLELNERYSDVTFRIIVIRAARGDTPTRATLFNNESGNKMLDSLNKERYTVLKQKFVKLRAPNVSMAGTNGTSTQHVYPPAESTGVYYPTGTAEYNSLSRATRIVRMWIPGTRFGRGGNIQYENGQQYTKFFDYHVVCYAYSNYSTLQDFFEVGRVNEYLTKMYYKDA